MGQDPDQTVREIREVRGSIERDLRELEERVPAPLRSVKAIGGILLGGGIVTTALLKLVRRNKKKDNDVTIRVIHESATPGTIRIEE